MQIANRIMYRKWERCIVDLKLQKEREKKRKRERERKREKEREREMRRREYKRGSKRKKIIE